MTTNLPTTNIPPTDTGEELPSLPWRLRIGYAFGEVINEITGSLWFSYSLLLFKMRMPNIFAGALMLIGQLSDAISTLSFGYIIDAYTLGPRIGDNYTFYALKVIVKLHFTLF